ncbi:MAG TPA: DUF4157 domain-containing protein [Gemmatimonadaceae bacterium]|jgi:hypothetical protein
MGIVARVTSALMGERIQLPDELLSRYPDLGQAQYRRGGLPPRIAGWTLGMSSAAAITLWNTIFLAPAVRLEAELLLHELRHVHQFSEHKAFPVSYLWQSIRHGYDRNAYEVDARRYSASRLATGDKEL